MERTNPSTNTVPNEMETYEQTGECGSSVRKLSQFQDGRPQIKLPD